MVQMELEQVAAFMKSFSNPIRLKIIEVLNGREKPVKQIVQETGEKQCYVSQQLQYLAKKGILNRRADNHFVYYSLKDTSVLNMLEMVNIGIKTAS